MHIVASSWVSFAAVTRLCIFSHLICLEVGQLSTVNEAELHILCRELSADSNSILILLRFMKSAEM